MGEGERQKWAMVKGEQGLLLANYYLLAFSPAENAFPSLPIAIPPIK